MQPHWHPSGNWIFLAVERDTYSPPPFATQAYIDGQLQDGLWTNMWAVSPDGLVWTRLTDFRSGVTGVADGFTGPAITPDGTKAVWSQIMDGNIFAYYPFGRWQLTEADLDVSSGIPTFTNIRDVTPPGMNWNEPGNFSPDNESLLFTGSNQADAEGMDQYILNVRTGALTNLTNSPTVWDEHGVFSPDGKKIIFMSAYPYRSDPSSSKILTIKTEFMLMDRDGSNLIQLTHFRTPGYPEYEDAGIAATAEWDPGGRTAYLSRLFFPNYEYWDLTFQDVLSIGGQAFSASGGSGSVTITASSSCSWSVSNVPSFVTITSAASGTGNGTVTFQVAPNAGGPASGTFTIAGASFTVEQQAAGIPGLSFIGSLAHVAAEENWTTTFTLVDKSASPATARLSLFGDPNGALTLPVAFPQQSGSEPILATSLDRTIAANASLIITTAGPQVPPVQVGSAQLAATAAVDGFAIFHLIPGAQEAVVPLETRNASSYLLPFDNTGGVVLGVAVENVSAQAASVPLVIRDDTGTVISSPGAALSLAGNGHTSFVLSTPYPVTAGKRGTIEFDTPSGGQISVLGIRTTPLGTTTTTLTSIPALANVGTGGGSIAHITTGNGWQTTFVLVNTGTSAAQANLNFFADNGASLSLPLGFPQTGNASTTTTAPSVNQIIPAGASLIVQSAAPASDPAPTIGSAQLNTDGHIGGFVIFRYNPNGQEAVVPLESRNANGYILAFDNTHGTATGVALNSVSTQAANIPVVVRDESGAQIATDTISLAANGHLAFTLGTDKYPGAANIRGTIEFDAPPGAHIGALGIRIPTAHTFTTLPALAK